MVVQVGLCRICSETTLLVFSRDGLNIVSCVVSLPFSNVKVKNGQESQFIINCLEFFFFQYVYCTLSSRLQIACACCDVTEEYYKYTVISSSDESDLLHSKQTRARP